MCHSLEMSLHDPKSVLGQVPTKTGSVRVLVDSSPSGSPVHGSPLQSARSVLPLSPSGSPGSRVCGHDVPIVRTHNTFEWRGHTWTLADCIVCDNYVNKDDCHHTTITIKSFDDQYCRITVCDDEPSPIVLPKQPDGVLLQTGEYVFLAEQFEPPFIFDTK